MGAALANTLNEEQKNKTNSAKVVVTSKRGADTAALEDIIKEWDDDTIELALNEDGELIKLLQSRDIENIPSSSLDLTDTIAEIKENPEKFEGIVDEILDLVQKFQDAL